MKHGMNAPLDLFIYDWQHPSYCNIFTQYIQYIDYFPFYSFSLSFSFPLSFYYFHHNHIFKLVSSIFIAAPPPPQTCPPIFLFNHLPFFSLFSIVIPCHLFTFLSNVRPPLLISFLSFQLFIHISFTSSLSPSLNT